MAFLDNSGDIILDAVLTDLGRKRLAEGNFRITQFAFGDDEIDYSLYDKNHPSGSAYYDLEILQTPVFESFTRSNANINYGLASYNGNPNLFYLPSMIQNTKSPNTSNGNVQLSTNVAYMALGNNTRDALQASGRLGSSFRFFVGNGSSAYILFETGLNTLTGDANPAGTTANQTSLVVNQGLLDPFFVVSADNRLFDGIKGMTAGSTFKMDSGTDGYGVGIDLASDTTTLAAGNDFLDSYGSATVLAKRTQISSTDNDSEVTDTVMSAINGPRGAFAAFRPNLVENLRNEGTRDSAFELYGKINQNLFSDGQLFDFIDTVLYVRGLTTGATSQVVVRIIRKV
tara:strand:- start:11698 stop:12726 length:1029 start_codon:yes stop_codon:yes gene_type:complete